ncbi:MAG: hypothetical protein PHG35_08260 [Dehalococcoidales bacterium]|nr:hypothetical protein [Dehalococcoidales bacterium]
MPGLPVIDQSKCNCCGLCVNICTRGALKIEGNTVKAVPVEDPDWCTMCELVCPTGAITCPFEIIIDEDGN